MQHSDILLIPKNCQAGGRVQTTYEQQREWDHSTAMQRAWEEGADGTFAQNLKLDHEGFPILDPYLLCVPSALKTSRFQHTRYNSNKHRGN
jgi:hypothetical protein